MFWTFGAFPELEHLEPDERKQLLAQTSWWTYPLLITSSALPALAVAAAATALAAQSAFPGAAMFWAVLIIVSVGVYQILLRHVRRIMRGTIIEGFAGQRPPFCFRCGYDLRGIHDGSCPECGNRTA